MFSGFTFNNQHSSQYGLYVKSINRPLLPELRKRELVVPGKDGAYDFEGNTYENRLIELRCTMLKPKMSELRQQARVIAGWLKNKAQLRFDDEPDKYYVGRIFQSVPLENVVGTGVFELIFECEPFAYGEVQLLEVERTDDTAIFITNSGNTETPNVINITNTGNAPINGFTLRFIKGQLKGRNK